MRDIFSEIADFPRSVSPYIKLTYLTSARYTGGGDMIDVLMRLLGDETGATAIEYGLIAALIAVAAVGVMTTIGHNLSTTFNTVATKL
jgi:pilus assembly protein Flp/PilA